MRCDCIIFLVTVRVAMSFLVPLSFQKPFSQSPQGTYRNALWVDGNSGGGDILSSLDYFLSTTEVLNKKNQLPDPIRIVSRGSNDIPPVEAIGTRVFYDPNKMEIAIVNAEENTQIDLSVIQNLCSNYQLAPVPLSDMIQSLCGFPAETLPPLGHDTQTVSTTSCRIIFDKQLLKHCEENDLLMMGGAGHPYWKSLLTVECIWKLQNAGEVLIADVTLPANDSDRRLWEVSSTGNSSSKTNDRMSNIDGQLHPKPFFPVDGPPINIARLVVRQKEISNPLSPVFLTAIGRIGNVHMRAKRSLRCAFLPPIGNQQKKMNDERDDPPDPRPWRSATLDDDMSANLVFGKVLLQNIGTKRGESLIENIQEGDMIQIEAKTNPSNRESTEKWVNSNSLELTLTDCLLLSHKSATSNNSSSENEREGSSVNIVGPSLPTLSMDSIFKDSSSSIEFIDDLDGISHLSCDLVKLCLQASEYHDSDPDSFAPVVGIDCEWQPREFMERKDQPQPVLLLQISLHALQKVYILDLQALLRPLELSSTPMNHMEEEVSNCLSQLMTSKRLIKVGYQISSDLRRTFASYPHVPCFQEISSVLEVSSLIKRVLRLSKQKKSRHITMSLASMTSHYLEMELNKEHQMTDWAVRELTEKQLQYAALDAAVTPILLEKAIESIDAYVSMDHLPTDDEGSPDSGGDHQVQPNGPIIRRNKDDDALAKEIVSYRFFQLPGEEIEESTISDLQAKQIVGPSWISTVTWTAVQQVPPPIVLPAVIS